ncbi:hypothetical protein BGV22_20465, partial [Clostridioides difficile]
MNGERRRSAGVRAGGERLFAAAGHAFAPFGQVVGAEDRQHGHQHHQHGHHVGDRDVTRAAGLVEQADRQGARVAGGEGGDEDLVEGQGEGEHAAGQQGRAEVRQDHVAEGLPAIGAQVHG